MSRKFELRPQDSQQWLPHLHRIAEFCEIIGIEADKAQRPVILHLVIHPETPKSYPQAGQAALQLNR